MNTVNDTSVTSVSVEAGRITAWAYCDASAINGRDLVIQVDENTVLGFTQKQGRIVIASCKAGEVGQVWYDGDFHWDFDPNKEEMGYVYLGKDGSVNFAEQVNARKGMVWSPSFDEPPTLPNQAKDWPGVVAYINDRLERDDLTGVELILSALKRIRELQVCGVGHHQTCWM